MALNTAVPVKQVGNTTVELSAKTGVARQLVIDTTKNTAVIMDGTTPGGHPLAKEGVKIKSGSPSLKINGGTEGTLGGDLTITVLPGYVPTGFEYVENPDAQHQGKYLAIKYTDDAGSPQTYYVDAAMLVDTYTAAAPLQISGTNEITIKLGAGLKLSGDSLVLDWSTLDLSEIIDTNSLLTIKDKKLSLKPIVSTDADNILAEGSDGGVYMPGDLGSLA